MASEYFSSLHYIWLNVVFFIFSLFLFAVCLYACLFVRWVYKRRLRQKTDAMIECYKNGEDKRKEMELNMKRQELHPQPEKKKSSKPNRKIHIVSKPCNEVIQKTDNEYIVRQVNEGGLSDEVACSPTKPTAPPVQRQLPVRPVQYQQPLQQAAYQQPSLQTQYVMVPVELLRVPTRSTIQMRSPMAYPNQKRKMIVESVATQTSETSVNELEKKSSEDWLAGYDERDAEKEEDRIDIDEEETETESDKVMKKRNARNQKLKREKEERKEREKQLQQQPVQSADELSDETRVSMEGDLPSPASSTPTSSAPTSSASTTPTTSSATTASTTSPNSSDAGSNSKETNSEEGKPKKADTDPSVVRSDYYSIPGKGSGFAPSAADSQPKQSSPAPRASMFPYFVDSKAPEAETTTGKSVAKVAEPHSSLEHDDSSCELYRNSVKSKVKKSEKHYLGTPKPRGK